jgi:hypothetical protein
MIVPLSFPVVCLIILIQIKPDITNCSNQQLNILNDVKFYFELINSEGMVILGFFVISVVNQSRKKAGFFFCRCPDKKLWPLLLMSSMSINCSSVLSEKFWGHHSTAVFREQLYPELCSGMFLQVIYKTTQICRKDAG